MSKNMIDYDKLMVVEPVKIEQNYDLITEYTPQFCAEIIEHGHNGYSPDTWAGKKGIPPRYIDEWRDKYPDFNDSYNVAISKQAYSWENNLNMALMNQNREEINVARYMLSVIYEKNPVSNKPISLYNPDTKKKKISDQDKINLATEFEILNKLKKSEV